MFLGELFMNKSIIFNILEKCNLEYDTLIKKGHGTSPEVLAGPFIEALIKTDSQKEAAVVLNLTERTMQRVIQNAKFLPTISGATKHYMNLLNLVNLFKCYDCKEIKSLDRKVSSHSYKCKDCDNAKSKVYREQNKEKCRERSRNHYYNNKSEYIARNAAHRANKVRATPAWADKNKIKEIYKNCPEGYHVDHIIPLQGDFVCGLHVETNLQYLPAEENLKKSNKYTL